MDAIVVKTAGAGNKYPFADNDRTCRPATRQIDLPRHVLFLAPLERNLGIGGDAIALAATELKPIGPTEQETTGEADDRGDRSTHKRVSQ